MADVLAMRVGELGRWLCLRLEVVEVLEDTIPKSDLKSLKGTLMLKGMVAEELCFW